MDDSLQPPPLNETLPVPATSLAARLSNVFISPSEVFDEIKSSPPRPANWVVPLVASMIVGIIYSLVVFSQPRIVQGMKDFQEQQVQKMVAQGKLKQDQADKFIATADKFISPTFLKISGAVSATFGSAAMLFLAALLFWLIGKYALHGTFTYMQAVEAIGLSTMILMLGTLVAMLLAVIYGNLYMTPGPVLLINNYDMTNKIHLLLSRLNITTIWWIVVIAIGLARLSNTKTAKAAAWLFAIWIVFTAVPIFIFTKK